MADNKHPLRAKASATAPTWQEGDSVPLSVDLAGTLRTTAGAGGGGLAGDVTIHDQANPTRFLAISAGGAASVTVGNFPGSQAVTGPLTDTQLRASAVPVSGTFYQGTQPVSAAALPLPSGASTEATLALIKAKTDNLDVALSTRTKPSDMQPVSGTFWQATQPVSIAATVAENVSQWGGSATTLGQKAMASSVPVTLASDQSTIATKAFQAVTYTAIYRLATRPYALSNAFGAAGRKQYATIFHAATAVKLVKVKRVEVALESSSVAAIVMADLVRLTNATTPATGNPAVTPTPQNPGDGGSEATCLSLPTTAGTEGAVHSFLEWNLGITGAASVLNPPPALNWYTLWPQVQGAGEVPENKYPTMRAATAEGFAVTVDSNAIGTVKGYVVMEFSEE